MKYEEAMNQLQEIVRKMENDELDIDQMAEQLKRAQELIRLCRDKLTKTDEEIRNLRYVPYPKGEKNEFELYATSIEKSGFMVPGFLCQVPHEVLLSDMDEQLVVNKIAEIHEVKDRYAGWKVGDTTQAITDGNFE